MSDKTVVATYTGHRLQSRNEKEVILLAGPVTKKVGKTESVNKSAKGFTAPMLTGATVTVNKDGTLSVTINEGVRGRQSKAPLADPLAGLTNIPGLTIK